MTINPVPHNTSFSNTSFTTNAEKNELQTQLTNKQQHLQRLSSDNNMTPQDKEKERREIQREITELNRKLRLERMEEKQEAKEAEKEQSKKKIIREELLEQADSNKTEDDSVNKSDKETDAKHSNNKKNEDSYTKGLPLVTIKNVLSAESDTEQNRVQNKITNQINNQKDILKAEIKSDSILGTDTTEKKEALSALRKKEPIQIKVLNQEPEPITPNTDIGSKIIIRE